MRASFVGDVYEVEVWESEYGLTIDTRRNEDEDDVGQSTLVAVLSDPRVREVVNKVTDEHVRRYREQLRR